MSDSAPIAGQPTWHRLTQHTLPAILLLIFFLITITTHAQPLAPVIDLLEVEFWPDFDRPSVLVLLTGTLPEDTNYPAMVVVPIPENATVNAIARVDESGSMFSDLEVDDSVPGQLTITTMDPTFRVEYYVPYSAEGNQRNYTFEWQSNLTVNELVATVQQPSLANEINLSPEAIQVNNRPDGLLYHTLPVREVPAGEMYSLEMSYNLLRPQLSAELLGGQQPAGPSNITGNMGGQESGFNWQIALAAAAFGLAIAAGVWLLLGYRRSRRRVSKPRPVRRSRVKRTASSINQGSTKRANFCYECGQRLTKGDKFCRNCGTAVKGA
jgi:hypothetical protein